MISALYFSFPLFGISKYILLILKDSPSSIDFIIKFKSAGLSKNLSFDEI